jgi:hypothetical protein
VDLRIGQWREKSAGDFEFDVVVYHGFFDKVHVVRSNVDGQVRATKVIHKRTLKHVEGLTERNVLLKAGTARSSRTRRSS